MLQIVLEFPPGDVDTEELLNEWKALGVEVEISTERAYLGGPELVSAALTLSTVGAFLLGRYFEVIKSRKVKLKYKNGELSEVDAAGMGSGELVKLLAHSERQDRGKSQ